jgi:serine/threonine protein kinase
MGPRALELEDDHHQLCGTVVDGRYLVERVVGAGGFGVVYRAQHLRFESPVALKVVRPPAPLAAARAADFAERFLFEGKLLFSLSALHPSIVRVFEMGTLELAGQAGAPYLALEWLEGQSLEDALGERRAAGGGPHTFEEMVAMLDGPASALAVAHGKRIAHRDVKPANLFLAQKDGGPFTKLLDFGLAKAMGDCASTSEMFADSAFIDRAFTPSYAAPEQWLERLGASGAWSDVYSLALVAVELLSGRRPLAGANAQQLMAACVDPGFRPTPRSLGVPVSAPVEAVFARALRVDPRERFRDVGEFWRALRELPSEGQRPAALTLPASLLPARAPRPLDPTLATTRDLPQPAAAAHEEARPARMPRSPAVTARRVGLGLGAGLGLLGLSWWLLAGQAPPRRAVAKARVHASAEPARPASFVGSPVRVIPEAPPSPPTLPVAPPVRRPRAPARPEAAPPAEAAVASAPPLAASGAQAAAGSLAADGGTPFAGPEDLLHDDMLKHRR